MAGDNSGVVATDTMKNTTYALAREHLTGPIEHFGRVLAEHFAAFPQVAGATVSIREYAWTPIPTSAGPAGDAFVRTGELTRTAVVRATKAGVTIEAGLEDLTLMKTAKSGFAGFPRDEFTTLPEVDDRLMASRLSATWRYRSADVDFDAAFEGVCTTLLDVFAEHHSSSVQATIWTLGKAILESQPQIDEIRLTMPNLHHWLVDLAPFGQPNDREIYVPTSEPYGLIEATVRRSETSARTGAESQPMAEAAAEAEEPEVRPAEHWRPSSEPEPAPEPEPEPEPEARGRDAGAGTESPWPRRRNRQPGARAGGRPEPEPRPGGRDGRAQLPMPLAGAAGQRASRRVAEGPAGRRSRPLRRRRASRSGDPRSPISTPSSLLRRSPSSPTSSASSGPAGSSSWPPARSASPSLTAGCCRTSCRRRPVSAAGTGPSPRRRPTWPTGGSRSPARPSRR